jgi:hypothetical protein
MFLVPASSSLRKSGFVSLIFATLNFCTGSSSVPEVLNMRFGWGQVCPPFPPTEASLQCSTNIPDSNWFPVCLSVSGCLA